MANDVAADRALEVERALAPGRFVDSDHPDVIAWARSVVGDATEHRAMAVKLFYAVRDGWRYDPYTTGREPEDFMASNVLKTRANWCVPKSVLLTAGARALGVPSRLGFADVRNHLQSAKLLESMGTDLFAWHGYSEFHLDGRWVKASSAFNIEMCHRFGTLPLEFDGTQDALLHAFDASGNRHMEYVHQRGSFDDLPYDELMATFRSIYKGYSPDPDRPAVHDEMFHD